MVIFFFRFISRNCLRESFPVPNRRKCDKEVFSDWIFENEIHLISTSVFHKYYWPLYQVYIYYTCIIYVQLAGGSFLNTTSYESYKERIKHNYLKVVRQTLSGARAQLWHCVYFLMKVIWFWMDYWVSCDERVVLIQTFMREATTHSVLSFSFVKCGWISRNLIAAFFNNNIVIRFLWSSSWWKL